jgi:hypothetical protein
MDPPFLLEKLPFQLGFGDDGSKSMYTYELSLPSVDSPSGVTVIAGGEIRCWVVGGGGGGAGRKLAGSLETGGTGRRPALAVADSVMLVCLEGPAPVVDWEIMLVKDGPQL